jgi:hypothetical protein
VAGVARPVLAEGDQPDTEHLQMLKLLERFVQTIESCPDLLRRSCGPVEEAGVGPGARRESVTVCYNML